MPFDRATTPEFYPAGAACSHARDNGPSADMPQGMGQSMALRSERRRQSVPCARTRSATRPVESPEVVCTRLASHDANCPRMHRSGLSFDINTRPGPTRRSAGSYSVGGTCSNANP